MNLNFESDHWRPGALRNNNNWNVAEGHRWIYGLHASDRLHDGDRTTNATPRSL
jgi:hypothetical protein